MKHFPFIPDLNELVLDSFAEDLVEICHTNAKNGGLNTNSMKIILSSETIRKLASLEQNAELKIMFSVNDLIVPKDSKMDQFIDETLKQLKDEDSDIINGTKRLHKKDYQDFLMENAVPKLDDKITSMLNEIVKA